jgi:myosin heavy subunit
MRFKLVLPWLCALGLLAGVGALYSLNQKQQTELVQLREACEQLRGELAVSTNTQASAESEEVIRLRKDNEDLLRLRNEVRQLRGEKQDLNRQVATSQAQARDAQAQVQAQAQVAKQTAQNQAAELQEVMRQRYGAPPTTPEQAAAFGCINNLRQIDGAKQQWALENRKPANTLVNVADITPYLRGNKLPVCPVGGVYTLNTVEAIPTCTVAGHILGK